MPGPISQRWNQFRDRFRDRNWLTYASLLLISTGLLAILILRDPAATQFVKTIVGFGTILTIVSLAAGLRDQLRPPAAKRWSLWLVYGLCVLVALGVVASVELVDRI